MRQSAPSSMRIRVRESQRSLGKSHEKGPRKGALIDILWRYQEASLNLSAPARSTETNVETPRSCMVTPKRRLMRAIVSAW